MTRRPPMVDSRGFPAGEHPENLTAELPEADEEWLAALADELWPEDEYADLITEHGRRIGGAA
jgi:hypothetical protein